jgi:hypothetical protein
MFLRDCNPATADGSKWFHRQVIKKREFFGYRRPIAA